MSPGDSVMELSNGSIPFHRSGKSCATTSCCCQGPHYSSSMCRILSWAYMGNITVWVLLGGLTLTDGAKHSKIWLIDTKSDAQVDGVRPHGPAAQVSFAATLMRYTSPGWKQPLVSDHQAHNTWVRTLRLEQGSPTHTSASTSRAPKATSSSADNAVQMEQSSARLEQRVAASEGLSTDGIPVESDVAKRPDRTGAASAVGLKKTVIESADGNQGRPGSSPWLGAGLPRRHKAQTGAQKAGEASPPPVTMPSKSAPYSYIPEPLPQSAHGTNSMPAVIPGDARSSNNSQTTQIAPFTVRNIPPEWSGFKSTVLHDPWMPGKPGSARKLMQVETSANPTGDDPSKLASDAAIWQHIVRFSGPAYNKDRGVDGPGKSTEHPSTFYTWLRPQTRRLPGAATRRLDSGASISPMLDINTPTNAAAGGDDSSATQGGEWAAIAINAPSPSQTTASTSIKLSKADFTMHGDDQSAARYPKRPGPREPGNRSDDTSEQRAGRPIRAGLDIEWTISSAPSSLSPIASGAGRPAPEASGSHMTTTARTQPEGQAAPHWSPVPQTRITSDPILGSGRSKVMPNVEPVNNNPPLDRPQAATDQALFTEIDATVTPTDTPHKLEGYSIRLKKSGTATDRYDPVSAFSVTITLPLSRALQTAASSPGKANTGSARNAHAHATTVGSTWESLAPINSTPDQGFQTQTEADPEPGYSPEISFLAADATPGHEPEPTSQPMDSEAMSSINVDGREAASPTSKIESSTSPAILEMTTEHPDRTVVNDSKSTTDTHFYNNKEANISTAEEAETDATLEAAKKDTWTDVAAGATTTSQTQTPVHHTTISRTRTRFISTTSKTLTGTKAVTTASQGRASPSSTVAPMLYASSASASNYSILTVHTTLGERGADAVGNMTVPSGGKLSTGAVSAIAIACIVTFWLILGPIVCAICRIKDKAQQRKNREQEDEMSHWLVEEMIRMELARGREKMYRTAVQDEREIERLPVNGYAEHSQPHTTVINVDNYKLNREQRIQERIARNEYVATPLIAARNFAMSDTTL